MRQFQARLTCVKGPCFAFGQLIKTGQVVVRKVTKFDDEDMVKDPKTGALSNPPKYSAMEPGYRDIDPPGTFRIEEVGGGVPKVEVQDLIIEALGKMDHEDPSQWDNKGLPKVDVVAAISGTRVTRGEIDNAIPGFKRTLKAED